MVIGYLASRHIKTLEDYLITDRRLTLFLAVPTIVATWFGAGSCMGVSGTVYGQGFYGVMADPFGCSLALIIMGLFFAAPFRRLKLTTISDLLAKAYGSRFETVSTLMMLPFYVGTLASQMVAMGYIFHVITGNNPHIGMLIGTLIVVIYTVSGGMWAVTVTDFLQFALLFVGLMLILPICFDQVSDQKMLMDSFFSEFSSLLPKRQSGPDWLAYLGRILMTGLGAIMGQDLIQRFLACRSEGVARTSAILGGGVYFLLGLIPLFVGVAGRFIFPELDQHELLIPLLAKEFLSPVVFVVFACGLLSAIMSTADSYLLAGAALVTKNLLVKQVPNASEKSKILLVRVVSVGISIVALLLALSGQTIFNLMVHSGALLFVAVFAPVTAALFWRLANLFAAWASVICGVGSWMGFLYFDPLRYGSAYEDKLFAAALFGASFSLGSYVVATLVKGIASRREVYTGN